MTTDQSAASNAEARFRSDSGEMEKRIAKFDWGGTSMGPSESWSPALGMTVRLMLANSYPMLLWWGSDYISIYNDAYRSILGAKHPWGLGKPVRECWKEIWHVLQPLIDKPFHGGEPTWNDDIPLEINRHGFLEEAHFTIGYSAVPDDSAPGGIGGVLATVQEITGKVVGERRVIALRDLSMYASQAKTAEEACAIAAKTLAPHDKDIPFLQLYLIDEELKHARLAGVAAGRDGSEIHHCSLEIDKDDACPWPIQRAIQSETMQIVERLSERFSPPSGPWSDPPHSAVVVPIGSGQPFRPTAVMVAGLSPRLELDSYYRDFLGLVAGQIGTIIANARANEQEKRRLAALAELDRAKIAFFSNVSHEFRTPLTLMLAPIEDGLSDPKISANMKERLDLAHRNSLRLLKLVNSLLDFSRIEAGRVEASFEPTDLAAFTTDIASVFRSAIERAGMKFAVQCQPLGEPAYVDREMWEKIVLNLLSNAFKYTLDGGIALSLRPRDGQAELVVNDTGVGIPESELPRLFQRFHRVEGAGGRTQEGSGIGLALVQELLKLHGGTIRASSNMGVGSTFIVSIPLGKTHLPADHVRIDRKLTSTAIDASAFVEEAMRWLPGSASNSSPEETPLPAEPPSHIARLPETRGARILLADDNADMRGYLTRLLEPFWTIEAVADGKAALEAARRQKPDLILSDVMMPRIDGFELVRQVRADESLQSVQVILLSARAGEESRVEGMETGADDYLIKPFSARELLARVSGSLAMAKIRRETSESLRAGEERFRAFVTASSEIVYSMSPDWEQMHHLWGRQFIADTSEPTASWLEKYIHPDDRPQVLKAVQQAIQTQSAYELEHRVLRTDGTFGWVFSRAIPIFNADGKLVEWFGAAADITDRKQGEAALAEARQRMDVAVGAAELGTFNCPLPLGELIWNDKCKEHFFLPSDAKVNIDKFYAILHRDDRERVRRSVESGIRDGEPHAMEYRTVAPDGRVRWIRAKFRVYRDPGGNPTRLDGVTLDITDLKRIEEERMRLLDAERSARAAAERSSYLKDEFLATLSHELRTPLNAILGWAQLLRRRKSDDDINDGLAAIERNSRAQGQLIEDLLDMSRIVSGKMRIDVQRVNLADVIRTSVESVQPTADAKQIRLQSVVDWHLGAVRGDPARLQQVIWNLLSNALKFTPRGGRVQVSLARVNSHAEITVADNGMGIAADFLPYIFDRFRQGDGTSTRKHGGLGLGLAIVKSLVEVHGGKIRAASPNTVQPLFLKIEPPAMMVLS